MSLRSVARTSGIACLAYGLFAACSGNSERERDVSGGTAGTRAGAEGDGGTLANTSGAAGSNGGSSAFAGSGGASELGGGAGRAGSAALGGDGGRAGSAGLGGAGGRAGAAGVGGAGGRAGAAGLGGDGGRAGSAGLGGSAGSTNGGGRAGAPYGGEAGAAIEPEGLSWPIDCVPDETCLDIGFPDTDGDGRAYDCTDPGYPGHEGTDIRITPEAQAAGMAVRAAADGVVVFAFDGKYDQCPNPSEPDCQEPPTAEPGSTAGTTVCSPVGPYCGTGQPGCYWCFAGGNVIVLRHEGVPGVFATRYDHLKRDSVLVQPGDTVSRGQKIAEAASAGNSTGPHLHFEVWGTGFYELSDPWAGACGPNTGTSLWAYDPPWSE